MSDEFNKEISSDQSDNIGGEQDLSQDQAPAAEPVSGDAQVSTDEPVVDAESEQEASTAQVGNDEVISASDEEDVSAEGLSAAYSHIIGEPKDENEDSATNDVVTNLVEPESADDFAEESAVAQSDEVVTEDGETEAETEVVAPVSEPVATEEAQVASESSETTGEAEDASEQDSDDEEDDEPLEDVSDEISTSSVVEAILFAADEPVGVRKIVEIINAGGVKEVKKHIRDLNKKYRKMGCAFRIEELAGGYQMLTQSAYNPWLSKLIKVRSETKLTNAAMETLAIIAYKQPLMRVEIENVRGVAAGEMIRQLIEKGMVKITGRAEELGRPLLYGTTQKFLDVFGLATIKDLPQPEAVKKNK